MVPLLLVNNHREFGDTHTLTKQGERFTKAGRGGRQYAMVFKLMRNRRYALAGRVLSHRRGYVRIGEGNLLACLIGSQIKDILDLDSHSIKRAWFH